MAENWGAMPLWGGRLGPHLTQCGQGRGLPACQLISFWVRPTVWPQYTKVTDRTGQIGEQSDSIWQTVLQRVAQKLIENHMQPIKDYLESP